MYKIPTGALKNELKRDFEIKKLMYQVKAGPKFSKIFLSIL